MLEDEWRFRFESESPSRRLPNAVTAGQEHTCAVANGGVQCWGSNTFGELGNSTTTNALSPVTAIPAGSNVVGIAVGVSTVSSDGLQAGFSCALLNGGAVCWGSNSNGTLANPFVGKDDKVLANITNALPPSAPTITASSAGASSITLGIGAPASNGGSVNDLLWRTKAFS